MPRLEGRPFSKDSTGEFSSQKSLGGGGTATEKPKKLWQLNDLRGTIERNNAATDAAREARVAGVAESMKLDVPAPPAPAPEPYKTLKQRVKERREEKAIDMTDEAELIEPPALDQKKVFVAKMKKIQAEAKAKKEQQKLAANFQEGTQRPVIANLTNRRDTTVRAGGPVEFQDSTPAYESLDSNSPDNFFAQGEAIDAANQETWQGADGIINQIKEKFGITLDADGKPMGFASKVKMKLQKKNPELQNMLISLEETLNPGTESTGEILPATPDQPAPNPVRRIGKREDGLGYSIAPSARIGEKRSTQTSDLGLTVDPVSGEKTLQHLMNESGAAPADNPSPSLTAETQAAIPVIPEQHLETQPVMPSLPPQDIVHTEPNMPAFAKKDTAKAA